MGDPAYDTTSSKKPKGNGLDHSSITQAQSSKTADVAHDKYADEFEGGWDKSRDQVAAPSRDAPFAGGHGHAGAINGVAPNQAGFADQLASASTAAVAAHSADWGVIAVKVEPVLKPCEDGIAQQEASIEKLSHEDHIGGDPSWLTREKGNSNTLAGLNMTSMMRYETEQIATCMAYNTWCPLANASHAAMAEIVEMATLLGFDPSKDKDSVRFIKSIETSLDMASDLVDAKMLGAQGKTSWSERMRDPSVKSDAKPTLEGTEMSPQLQGLTEAYRNLQTAHMDVYRSLLKDRKKAVDADIGNVQTQVAEINNVIAFWTQLGGVADAAIPHVNSAIHADQALTAKIGSGAGKGKAALHDAEKHAKRAEDHPEDYESDLKAHARADDYENNHDYWGAGEESQKANAPQAPNVPPPDELPSLSVSGLISLGMKLWSHDKLEALQSKLNGLQGESVAFGTTIDLTEALAAQQRYADAGKAFESRLGTLKDQGLGLREQDFRDTGAQLDAFAFEHRGALGAQGKGNLAPAAGHQIYGTMMAAMGKIEQYRAMSKLALSTFDYDRFSTTIRDQQLERANVKRPSESASFALDTYNAPPGVAPMSAEELANYQQIGGTYLSVSQQDAHWGVRLFEIGEKFQGLLSRLSGHGAGGIGKVY